MTVIKTFKQKELEKLFNRQYSKSPQHLQKRTLNCLELMDAAATLQDLRVVPGVNLEPLRGDREGQHSIHVSGDWRLCFVWYEGDVYDVELIDYH